MKRRLFETHLHSAEGYKCGRTSANDIPHLYKKVGYDGIIVTEHFMHDAFNTFEINGATTPQQKIDRFLYGYNTMKSVGEKLGLTVWLGMELGVYESVGMRHESIELLVYGFDEQFLYKHHELHMRPLKEIYSVIKANNLVCYQSHPFRDYCNRAPVDCVDGVEVYNGHRKHDSNNSLALSFANQHNLLKLSGSDFHVDGDEGRGGVYLPSDVASVKDFAEYAKTQQTTDWLKQD